MMVVSGCFCTTVVELSRCDQNHMTHKSQNIYLSCSLQKKSANPYFKDLNTGLVFVSSWLIIQNSPILSGQIAAFLTPSSGPWPPDLSPQTPQTSRKEKGNAQHSRSIYTSSKNFVWHLGHPSPEWSPGEDDRWIRENSMLC